MPSVDHLNDCADRQSATDAIEQMARHAGACEAVLQACRLLRAHSLGVAADLLLENVERITGPQS